MANAPLKRTATGIGTETGTGLTVDADGKLAATATPFEGGTVPDPTTFEDDVTLEGDVIHEQFTVDAGGVTVLAGSAGFGTQNGVPTTFGTGDLQSFAINMGFYSVAPVTQPETEGTVAGFTAGVGTPVNHDSTFTGGQGTGAYTIGDIVLALKQLGLLKNNS